MPFDRGSSPAAGAQPSTGHALIPAPETIDHIASVLRRSRATVLKPEKSLPNTPVVHVNHDDAVCEPTNQLVYQKGGWALHMLREQVGTDTFWRGIRDYYRRYLNATASTDDFRQIMEQASGQDPMAGRETTIRWAARDRADRRRARPGRVDARRVRGVREGAAVARRLARLTAVAAREAAARPVS
jgi:hypothetical protein